MENKYDDKLKRTTPWRRSWRWKTRPTDPGVLSRVRKKPEAAEGYAAGEVRLEAGAEKDCYLLGLADGAEGDF